MNSTAMPMIANDSERSIQVHCQSVYSVYKRLFPRAMPTTTFKIRGMRVVLMGTTISRAKDLPTALSFISKGEKP